MRNKGAHATNMTLLMVLSMAFWGGSWVSAKSIAHTMPPDSLAFWRFLVNLVFLAPALYFIKEPIRPKSGALLHVLAGALFMGVYFYLFFKGLYHGRAGEGGVLVTTSVPLITFALSILLLREAATLRKVMGLALGLTGGAIILSGHSFGLSEFFDSGSAYLLLAALNWALLTVVSQKAGDSLSPLAFSFYVHAICTVAFFFIALPTGSLALAFEQDVYFWLNMLYLGAVSNAFATTVYFYASARLSSFKASSFIYIVPACALMLSWLILDEEPLTATIIGGLVAMAATYVINRR